MSNLKKMYICTVAYEIGFMFCSGAIIQTFLLQLGLTEQEVYLFNSLTQMAQVAMMLVMTFFADKIRNVRRVTALSYSSLVIMTVAFLLGAINPEIVGNPYVIATFLIAALSYMGYGIYNILAYCLPYYVIDMKEYGKLTGINCLISGGASFVLSVAHTSIVSKFDYVQSMIWFFILTIVCFIFTSITCWSMKEIKTDEQEKKSVKGDMMAVFKNKDAYVLLIPNFTRGIAVGILNVIAVIAISSSVLNEKNATYVNIITQIALFAGNALYVLLYKKFSSKNLLLVSAMVFAIVFPMCIAGGLVTFVILFFIATFARVVIDTSIPVIVTEIIPQNQIGAYTSIRMLVFTGAQAIAPLIITPIVSVSSYTVVLIVAAVMHLICGVVYYAVAKKRQTDIKHQV